ncbi:MAG: hypothetical protein AABX29_07665 [Nanoarchaeota archaeon]
MVKKEGYVFYLDYMHSDLNWKDVHELEKMLQEKYGVRVSFSFGATHQRRDMILEVPKRDIDLLDEVLDILSKHHYRIEGFGKASVEREKKVDN